MDNGVEQLKATFADRPDLVFRHFEDCKAPMMRWQCGRNVTDVVDLPDGEGVIVERFELLAWAATSGELIDQLHTIPAPPTGPEWRFEVGPAHSCSGRCPKS